MKHLSVHAVDEEEHAGLDGAACQPQEDVGAIFELVDELLDLRFDVVRSPYWRAVAQEAALQPPARPSHELGCRARAAAGSSTRGSLRGCW
jgi:hypothetical protein